MRKSLTASLLLITIAVALTVVAAQPESAGRKPLFDGNSLAGWKAVEGNAQFKAVNGRIDVAGPGGQLVYTGTDGKADFTDFSLTANVLTHAGANCGIVFDRGLPDVKDSSPGFEVRINNTPAPARNQADLLKTGSLVGLRQQFKSIARDDRWFQLGIRVCGQHVQVTVNHRLVVDYVASGLKPHGTFAIVTHPGHSEALFSDIEVGPAGADGDKPLAASDAIDQRIARLQAAGFPLIDFHIHLKGGLTAEQAVANSRTTGIFYGIAANCGLKFPITDDRGIEAYVAKMAEAPAFVGMQAEGREWPTLFSKQAIARFDYIFTDAMTIVDHRGRRARLWMPDEVDIPDKQAFMELLVRTIVDILDNEPIDIYVNPTYLPVVIAKEYDELWTPERLQKVIDAAARNGVAIEISNKLRLPKADFIKRAKRAGIKFTFGTNNVDGNLGRNEYGLDMIDACGLTWQDMWLPKPDGQKPVQVKKKR